MQYVTHDNGKNPNSLNSIVSCAEEHQLKQKQQLKWIPLGKFSNVRAFSKSFHSSFIMQASCIECKAGIKSSNVCDIFMRINGFADKKTTLQSSMYNVQRAFFSHKCTCKLEKLNGFTQHKCATVWFECSNIDSNLFPFHICVHYSKSDNYCIDNYR